MSNFAKVQSDMFENKQLVFVDHFFKNLNSSSLGANKSHAFTLLLKCEQLGFSFDNKLLNIVSHASIEEMEKFWDWMVKQNNKVYGASNYKPMYPNFPKQVIEASELELLINAFMHYSGDFFGFRIVPNYKEKERKSLKETVNPLRMSTITKSDIADLFVKYLTSNASMSVATKEVMKNMFIYLEEQKSSELEKLLIENEIPQKENLAFMGAVVLKSNIDFNKSLVSQFKTPTDLLRLSAAINDGDTSLAVDTKIKNMSRPMRKAFAAKLENMLSNGDKEQFIENLFTYKEQWTKLAHAIHIGEYKDKCPNAFEALQKIRQNDKNESFNFKIEKLLNKKEYVKASDILKSRPGIFGRMLNQVIAKASVDEQKNILNNFSVASKSIATPVLLQMHAKFKYDNQNERKIILPKGGLGKVFVKDTSNSSTLKVDDNVANKIVDLIEETLINRFKEGTSLGNVYIENSLLLQNIPFAQRTASKALRTVPKGSRFVKESDKPIIRFFTWWNEKGVDKNGNNVNIGRIDIDLSVGVFDKDYKLIKQCAYYDLRSSDYLTHSGDITSAPNGAAEYIDVHIDKLLKDIPGAAYVGQLISSYTKQKYADMPECYAGWMEREQKQHGKIFEPSTVKNKVDITCDSTQVLVCLYDILRKEYIWADTPMRASYSYNNLNSVKSAMAYTIEAIAEMKKPNLYDLFEMHAKARGTIVNKKEDANTIFSIHEGITPFDSELIASQFMADSYAINVPVVKKKLK